MTISPNADWRMAISSPDRSATQSRRGRTMAGVPPGSRVLASFCAHDGITRVVQPGANCMAVAVRATEAIRKLGTAPQCCGLQPMPHTTERPHAKAGDGARSQQYVSYRARSGR